MTSRSPTARRFPINRAYISIIIILAAIGLGIIIWGVIHKALNSTAVITDRLLSIALVAACLGCFAALLWKIYADSRVEISREMITRPSVFGLRKIKWSEVIR